MIQVKKIQIPELPTRKARRLYVSLPKDYDDSESRYPVLYMFDGHNVFYDRHATFGKSWGMKEYLQRTKLPLIVVAIECNPEGDRRLHEYAPWDFVYPPFGEIDGLGKTTMDWITRTLKPEIDRSYRTLPDREHTMIAGSSMGGLMTLYALVAYNQTFSMGAALSPSIWAGGMRLVELIAKAGIAAPTRVYLDLGTAEIPEDQQYAYSAMFGLAGTLSLFGADVAARMVPGAEHNEAAWEKRIPVFMDYLLKPMYDADRE